MGEWSSEEPQNGQLGHRNRQMVCVGGKLLSSTQEKKNEVEAFGSQNMGTSYQPS